MFYNLISKFMILHSFNQYSEIAVLELSGFRTNNSTTIVLFTLSPDSWIHHFQEKPS